TRIQGDYSAALRRWYHAVYLAAYIQRTVAQHRPAGRQLVVDPFRFATAHLRRQAASVNLSLARLLVVHVLLAVLIGGAFFAVFTGRGPWPFSPYPLFSLLGQGRALRAPPVARVPACPG